MKEFSFLMDQRADADVQGNLRFTLVIFSEPVETNRNKACTLKRN